MHSQADVVLEFLQFLSNDDLASINQFAVPICMCETGAPGMFV